MGTHRWRQLPEVLAVAAIVCLYVAVAAYQLRLPGLYNDEAYDVVPAMQLILHQPVELNRGVGIRLFGLDLPVMISDYQGVTSAYAVLPLFWLFGVGVLEVRALTIGFGAVAILLTYLLGRRLAGPAVGLTAALLLATSPSFIFWSRLGVYVVIQVVPLALGATLAVLRWQRGSNRGWLVLAGLCSGLGLATKLLFLWFLLGALAAGLAVWLVEWYWPLDAGGHRTARTPLRARLARRPALRPPDAVAAAAGFLAGAAPLLYYNAVSGGTLLVLRANLLRTEKGANNLAVVNNLLTQADALRVLLQGSYFWFLGGVFANVLTLPALMLSVAVLLAGVSLMPYYRRYRPPVIFALTLLAAIFVQSAFTLSGLEATHLLIMLPWPQLLIAGAVAMLADLVTRRWPVHAPAVRGRALHLAIFGLFIVPLVVGDLQTDRRYHQALAATGGKSSFSAAIYDLAAFLDRFGYTAPYALDWGMKYNVQLLTLGRVNPREIYGQTIAPPPSYYTTLDTLFRDPDAVYIAHRDEGPGIPTAYPGRVAAFKERAAAAGKVVVPLKVIYESGGAPLFYVYSVRDP